MLAYIVRRLLYAIPILVGVNLLTFALFFVVNTPDDMARMQLGVKRVTPEAIGKWKAERGYDKPLLVNFAASGLSVSYTHLADGSATLDIEGKQIKAGVNPELLRQMEALVPLGRGGTPEEAAGAIALLCYPESNYISGELLVCGGGFRI